MDLVTALVLAAAVILLGLGTAPPAPAPSGPPRSGLFEGLVEHHRRRLRAARLHMDPRTVTLVAVASPPVLAALGFMLASPVIAVLGAAGGFVVPRVYLDTLVRAQRRRSEAEAPRLLQVILASLAAGRTYLEALEEARGRAQDRWLRDDLDHVISRFHLDVPLEQSIAEVRATTAGRNLALIWDNLAICIANRIPASRAKGLLVELSSTVQFNVQLQEEVRSRTSGQRVQIWLLAAIVPALFLYLRVLNPDFFTVLDETAVGRFLLLPGAVCLELLGVVLSFRLSRVEA